MKIVICVILRFDLKLFRLNLRYWQRKISRFGDFKNKKFEKNGEIIFFTFVHIFSNNPFFFY